MLRVVALSGGFSRPEACAELAKNRGMIASFSRALLEDLRHQMTDAEFDALARRRDRRNLPGLGEQDRGMSDAWRAVDAYLAGKLLGDDPALDAALSANAEGGLPAIDVSPVQGKLLHLLARARRRPARSSRSARSAAIRRSGWPARCPTDGRVVTLEIDPHHAEVARANLDRAGVGDRVEIRVGPALETLARCRPRAKRPSISSSSTPTSRTTPITFRRRSIWRGRAR